MKRSPLASSLAVLALLAVAVAGCANPNDPDSSRVDDGSDAIPATSADDTGPTEMPDPPNPDAGVVEYRITSTGSSKAGVITYSLENGSLAQVTLARLPWRKRIDGSSDGLYVLNAQNAGSGAISCTILVDGVEVASSTSTGPYAGVQCVPE